MEQVDEALVLTAVPHGEHGAVVRFLTFSSGLRTAYVPGARGRRMRGAIQPATKVRLTLKERAPGQLPTARIEALDTRALIAFDPVAAAALAWLSLLLSDLLSESVEEPRITHTFDALCAVLDSGAGAAAVAENVARMEFLFLAEQGFGIDVSSCVLSGPADDLSHVSPKSGRAISRSKAAGQPWEKHLLVLPAFLWSSEKATATDVVDALRLTGHFLDLHLLGARPRLVSARTTFLRTTEERLTAVGSAQGGS